MLDIADMKIGTPPKVFRLLIDSGSADLWVGATGCRSDAGGGCVRTPHHSRLVSIWKKMFLFVRETILSWGRTRVARIRNLKMIGLLATFLARYRDTSYMMMSLLLDFRWRISPLVWPLMKALNLRGIWLPRCLDLRSRWWTSYRNNIRFDGLLGLAKSVSIDVERWTPVKTHLI